MPLLTTVYMDHTWIHPGNHSQSFFIVIQIQWKIGFNVIPISQEVPINNLIHNMCSGITLLKLLPHPPGANVLNLH